MTKQEYEKLGSKETLIINHTFEKGRITRFYIKTISKGEKGFMIGNCFYSYKYVNVIK